MHAARHLWPGLVLAFAIAPAGAQAPATPPGTAPPAAAAPAASPPPLPLWEVGVAGVVGSQPAYPGADQQTGRALVLPYAIYRGQLLRTDRGGLGLRAVRTPRFELELGVGGSLGSSSSRIDARRGMPDLGTLIEAGPSLRWNIAGSDSEGRWRLDLPLRAVFDLSDGLARRGLAFQPFLRHERRSGDWRWSAGAGAFIGDRRLGSTLYGVAPIDATATRPAYEARAGLVAWRFSSSLGRRITPDLSAFATLRLDSVAGAANRASPLVRQTTGWSAGIGLAYTLKASNEPAVD